MNTSTSKRPRDAASLIALVERESEMHVLMGRRSTRTRFMPSIWVFPGGRVDRSDRRHPVASPLAAHVERRLAANCRHPNALAVAAVRETLEETGLAVGRTTGELYTPELQDLDFVGRAITPTGNPIRYHARFFCIRWMDPDTPLRSNGELDDLAWLPVQEALSLPTIDVTDIMLREAVERLKDPAGSDRPTLFVRYRGATPMVGNER